METKNLFAEAKNSKFKFNKALNEAIDKEKQKSVGFMAVHNLACKGLKFPHVKNFDALVYTDNDGKIHRYKAVTRLIKKQDINIEAVAVAGLSLDKLLSYSSRNNKLSLSGLILKSYLNYLYSDKAEQERLEARGEALLEIIPALEDCSVTTLAELIKFYPSLKKQIEDKTVAKNVVKFVYRFNNKLYHKEFKSSLDVDFAKTLADIKKEYGSKGEAAFCQALKDGKTEKQAKILLTQGGELSPQNKQA